MGKRPAGSVVVISKVQTWWSERGSGCDQRDGGELVKGSERKIVEREWGG